MENIRLLEKEFVKKGIVYKQFERNEEKGYYIYKCENLNYKDEYFEIFKIKLSKPDLRFNPNADYDLMELYPSDESFGKWAWCCSNMEIVQRVINNRINNNETSKI